MSTSSPRGEARYLVSGSYFSPLSQAKLFVSGQSFEVLNISLGGLAFCGADTSSLKESDQLDASLSLMSRDWPVQIELKDIRGFRVSASFLSKSQGFHLALEEFLHPKRLGSSLKVRMDLSSDADVKALTPGAEHVEVYTGENESGVFIWLGPERRLLRFLATAEGLVVQWSPEFGLQSGQWGSAKDPVLDPTLQIGVQQWFTDYLLAWMAAWPGGTQFVQDLNSQPPTPDLRVPSSLEALLS